MIGTGPYDSLREYVEAIEEHGKLIRIDEIDQDAYELTGFMYKLLDKYGWMGAPAVIVEKVKIDGEWMQGPILINQFKMHMNSPASCTSSWINMAGWAHQLSLLRK